MKTFNYEVFIGTPSDVVSNVADSINNTFGKHGVHVKKTHKGVHDELIITVDDETYAWGENDIFQLASLIGSGLNYIFASDSDNKNSLLITNKQNL